VISTSMRNLLTIISMIGLLASLAVYIGSFFGLTSDDLGLRMLPLHGGMILMIGAFIVDRNSRQRQLGRTMWPYTDALEGLAPKWTVWSVHILFIAAILQFFLFLLLSHAAVPAIMDGRYVLNDHGTIKGLLSSAQYFRLKGFELRLFSSAGLGCYSFSSIYWWFVRGMAIPDA
jgi:hypothetical protein